MFGIIYILIALITLFIILHLFTELRQQDKIIIVSIVGILIILAIWYENNNNNQRDKTHKMLLRFEQGKELKCSEATVTKENFNYVSHTFIGLENSKFKGFIISEKQCK